MSDKFPVHYDNGLVRVYTNAAGDIIVAEQGGRVSMKFSRDKYTCGQLRFTIEGQLEPISVNDEVQWCVVPR